MMMSTKLQQQQLPNKISMILLVEGGKNWNIFRKLNKHHAILITS